MVLESTALFKVNEENVKTAMIYVMQKHIGKWFTIRRMQMYLQGVGVIISPTHIFELAEEIRDSFEKDHLTNFDLNKSKMLFRCETFFIPNK